MVDDHLLNITKLVSLEKLGLKEARAQWELMEGSVSVIKRQVHFACDGHQFRDLDSLSRYIVIDVFEAGFIIGDMRVRVRQDRVAEFGPALVFHWCILTFFKWEANILFLVFMVNTLQYFVKWDPTGIDVS